MLSTSERKLPGLYLLSMDYWMQSAHTMCAFSFNLGHIAVCNRILEDFLLGSENLKNVGIIFLSLPEGV